MLLPEGVASLLQLGSLGQQVVLLQTYHSARAAHPDVADGLLRGEVMVLDEVAADEHPCPPQTRLAVDSQSPCTQYGISVSSSLSFTCLLVRPFQLVISVSMVASEVP